MVSRIRSTGLNNYATPTPRGKGRVKSHRNNSAARFLALAQETRGFHGVNLNPLAVFLSAAETGEIAKLKTAIKYFQESRQKISVEDYRAALHSLIKGNHTAAFAYLLDNAKVVGLNLCNALNASHFEQIINQAKTKNFMTVLFDKLSGSGKSLVDLVIDTNSGYSARALDFLIYPATVTSERNQNFGTSGGISVSPKSGQELLDLIFDPKYKTMQAYLASDQKGKLYEVFNGLVKCGNNELANKFINDYRLPIDFDNDQLIYSIIWSDNLEFFEKAKTAGVTINRPRTDSRSNPFIPLNLAASKDSVKILSAMLDDDSEHETSEGDCFNAATYQTRSMRILVEKAKKSPEKLKINLDKILKKAWSSGDCEDLSLLLAIKGSQDPKHDKASSSLVHLINNIALTDEAKGIKKLAFIVNSGVFDQLVKQGDLDYAQLVTKILNSKSFSFQAWKGLDLNVQDRYGRTFPQALLMACDFTESSNKKSEKLSMVLDILSNFVKQGTKLPEQLIESIKQQMTSQGINLERYSLLLNAKA